MRTILTKQNCIHTDITEANSYCCRPSRNNKFNLTILEAEPCKRTAFCNKKSLNIYLPYTQYLIVGSKINSCSWMINALMVSFSREPIDNDFKCLVTPFPNGTNTAAFCVANKLLEYPTFNELVKDTIHCFWKSEFNSDMSIIYGYNNPGLSPYGALKSMIEKNWWQDFPLLDASKGFKSWAEKSHPSKEKI